MTTKTRAAGFSTGSRARLNRAFLWPLALVAFLAPLLYGGNLPIYWLTWTLVAGILGTAWFGWLAWTGEAPRLGIGLYPVCAALFTVFAIFNVVQIVPIGNLAPDMASAILPGVTFKLSTISGDTGETTFALLRWLTCGIFFFLALQVAAAADRGEKLLLVLFWTIVLHALIGLIARFALGDTFLGLPKWVYQGSATGGFVNRNSFATYLAFGTVIGITRIFDMASATRNGKSKMGNFDLFTTGGGVTPYILGWLILMTALIASDSRMGLLSAIGGMLFVCLVFLGKRSSNETGTRRSSALIFFAILLIAAVGAIFLFGTSLYYRFENLYLGTDFDVRFSLYAQVWSMILERPLVGFGGSAFNSVFPLYHQLPTSFAYIWDKTHSTYLALWVEYGLIFGSLPMLIFLGLFIRLMKSILARTEARFVVTAAAGVLLTGALHSLVDFSLEMEGNAIVYSMIVAIGFGRVLARTHANRASS